jgi:hypothetical protein
MGIDYVLVSGRIVVDQAITPAFWLVESCAMAVPRHSIHRGPALRANLSAVVVSPEKPSENQARL